MLEKTLIHLQVLSHLEYYKVESRLIAPLYDFARQNRLYRKARCGFFIRIHTNHKESIARIFSTLNNKFNYRNERISCIKKDDMRMRKEATIEEWKKLYEVATRIRELKPWESLWDMDTIGVQTSENPEETVFYSILGRGGDCYGIVVYEGYDAFNSFLMLTMQDQMNLSMEHVMYNQENLTCYWGDREELSNKQRQVIKELGYKYRGKDNWLYFVSYEPGYWPFNMDQDEVVRMTEHLINLEIAFTHYKKTGINIDFDNGNMFSAIYSEDEKTWHYEEKPLPFDYYIFKEILIENEELVEELRKAPKTEITLEADARSMGEALKDKKYDRPIIPVISLLADSDTGAMITFGLSEPDENALVKLANSVIEFILEVGAPKEIRVSNVLVEAALDHICKICSIELRLMRHLVGIDLFWFSMKQHRGG